jgi:hypothetical protein
MWPASSSARWHLLWRVRSPASIYAAREDGADDLTRISSPDHRPVISSLDVIPGAVLQRPAGRLRSRPVSLARSSLAVVFVAAVAGFAAVLEPNAYPSYDYAFVLASAQDVLEGRPTGRQNRCWSISLHLFNREV